MQSIHCHGQRVHLPVPHRASARDRTDCHIRLRDPLPKTMVQLFLVIQEVWDDIHRPGSLIIWAHSCPRDAEACMRHTVCQHFYWPCCIEQIATINFCLANDDSPPIADRTHTKQFLWIVFTIIKFPVNKCAFLFVWSVYYVFFRCTFNGMPCSVDNISTIVTGHGLCHVINSFSGNETALRTSRPGIFPTCTWWISDKLIDKPLVIRALLA